MVVAAAVVLPMLEEPVVLGMLVVVVKEVVLAMAVVLGL